MKENRNRRMRDLLRTRPYTFTSGVFSPIQAKIAEAVGLEWVFVSGYSCSLGYLAKPDLGFATMSEMCQWSRMIASATSLPVLVDGDDGHGDILQAMRTVEEFERAGVSGMTLEDQRLPKRCGHLPGKQCLPIASAVAKIKAALAARSDPDFLIIARTDAIGSEEGLGIEDAIERGRRYADVGADVVWAEFSIPSRRDAETFATAMRSSHPELPLFFNYSSSFPWSRTREPLSFGELGSMGYRLMVVGLGAIHAGMRAEWNFMQALREREERGQWELEEALRGHPTEDHHAMGSWNHYQDLIDRFHPSHLSHQSDEQ